MEGSRLGTRLTEHSYRRCSIWDRLLLPRRRKTIYGRDDDDGLMLDWSTGAIVSLRAWLAPQRPEGASIFTLAANGDETCIAFGGKHTYVNVARISPAFEPLSCEQHWLGPRCVVVAHHPREDIVAALSLRGSLDFFDSRTWRPTRERYQGYRACYPRR